MKKKALWSMIAIAAVAAAIALALFARQGHKESGGVAVAVAPAQAKCPVPGAPFVNGDQFPDGGNTNHYYWIDVVASDRDADVKFCGDGPSHLPDPLFFSHAGETNRVLLLIGKRYEVFSEAAVRPVGASSAAVVFAGVGTISPENPTRRFSVRWPVTISLVPTPVRRGGLARREPHAICALTAAAGSPRGGVKVKYIVGADASSPQQEAEARANLEFARKELRLPTFEWGDRDCDDGKTEGIYRRLMEEKQRAECERRNAEWRRNDEIQRQNWELRYQAQLESNQLARVESDKLEFKNGNADSGLNVSFYYAAYSYKLSENGHGPEAARAARTAFHWLRAAADAGSVRAQSSLGWHLLNGGNAFMKRGPFEWSGPEPKIPKEGPYVHPGAFQGTDVPAEVLLGETNGVSRYFRVFSRDPVDGLRYMKLAADKGYSLATMWINLRNENLCDLSMPNWWLAKDGFSIDGKIAHYSEEVVTRTGFASTVKRRIGKDRDGNVVSISDEYFENGDAARRDACPWHEQGDRCVVTEVLP